MRFFSNIRSLIILQAVSICLFSSLPVQPSTPELGTFGFCVLRRPPYTRTFLQKSEFLLRSMQSSLLNNVRLSGFLNLPLCSPQHPIFVPCFIDFILFNSIHMFCSAFLCLLPLCALPDCTLEAAENEGLWCPSFVLFLFISNILWVHFDTSTALNSLYKLKCFSLIVQVH